MNLGVTISLVQNGQTLIAQENLVLQRVYFEDTNNITGTLAETEVIQAEMRRELVNRLLRRLEAAEPPALSNLN